MAGAQAMNVTETRNLISVTKRPSGVVVMLLDCPGKLNSLGSAVCHELELALDVVAADASIKAVVMASGKPDTFVIGADLYEIRKAGSVEELYKLSRDGQRTLDKIGAIGKPVVLGVNGACLGGGLELALAGQWRIGTDSPATVVGFPETRLGIIPGLGGTQRLPRLIGLKAALGVILSADAISVGEAKEMGIFDELVAPGELLAKCEERALEFAKDPSAIKERMQTPSVLSQSKYCLRDLDEEKALKLFAMTERSVRIKTRGNYPAQTKVVEVIKTGLFDGIDVGMEAEATVFSQLAASEGAHNLIALFFATDFARQSAQSLAAKFGASGTKKIGIIGSGTMGASLANLAASKGLQVILKVREGRQQQALENVRALLPRAKGEGADADSQEEVFSRVSCTADFGELADVNLIIEAVSEESSAKSEVLTAVSKAVSPQCTIATNTSSLTLADLSGSVEGADRFVGLHFFHPVDRMPLVEIISQKTTSKAAMARAADLVSILEKTPVMVKDGAGFLINRMLTCYLFEAARMAEEGVPLNWIEESAIDFGMPMGPIELLDEVGLETCFKVARCLHNALGDRMAQPEVLAGTQALGVEGKKTGFGIYLWDENGRRREFNPVIKQLTNVNWSADKSDEATRAKLSERLILPMVDEAARCLEEKIVMKAREIDMALILGIGFPPFRGGLLKYADKLGLKDIGSKLESIYSGSKPLRKVSALLTKYIAEGRGFYSLKAED
jgi:3-hydroxyacyl-CoA dehydrogenase/enoyl-CoA hydratase/3-hydroxybutyryl-CoA epimerase